MANHQISNNSVQAFGNRNEAKVEAVIVSLPFQGHQNQLLQLARVISSQNIPVHFVGPEIHNRQGKIRAQGWDPLAKSNLQFCDIPIPPFEVSSPNPNDPYKFPAHIMSLIPCLANLREPTFALLHDLANTSKRVILVVDLLMFWLFNDVSSVPNAELYCFHVFSAFDVYCIARSFAGKPVLLHGEPMKDFPPIERLVGLELLAYIEEHLKISPCVHGNLYNSCKAIEEEFLEHLAEEKIQNTDKHWGIGPFNPVSIPEPQRKTSDKYFEWLDKQQPKSVLFVAFGSTVSLSNEELIEIALGLERSGQKFLWVLRYADRVDCVEEETKDAQLPKGFEERIEERGIIIRGWAPQLEILGHPSIGGFLSHCGWNSTIESISMGVPFATWPMHSEQPINAIFLTEVLKIGVPVRESTIQINEIVRSEAIEKAVKRLMASAEGDEMRQRAAELRTIVKQSVKEGGATGAEIASFIAHITR